MICVAILGWGVLHRGNGAAFAHPAPLQLTSSTIKLRPSHCHPLGLALVPHRDQVIGILKDLLFARRAVASSPTLLATADDVIE
jgi:hypothetical protein